MNVCLNVLAITSLASVLLLAPDLHAMSTPVPNAAMKAHKRLKVDVKAAGKVDKEAAPRMEVAPKRLRDKRPRGAPRSLPFRAGEKLRYKLTWMGIPVGHAIFEVDGAAKFARKPVWKFSMKAWTNSFADRIYKVRDELHSWATPKMKRSVHHTKKAREGSYHRDIVVTFDWRKRLATYRNSKRTFKPRKIFATTYDPLALLYGFRCRKWDKPGTLKMSVSDGLKTIRADVRVLGREEVEIGGELIDSWKVMPELKDVGGIFKRSKGATMEVWVSTDRRHIPLRLRSKVIVGSFTATLVSATGLRR